MGAFLEKPKTEKHNEVGSGNGIHYGLASMQGWRVEMEDAHCAVAQMTGKMEGWSFFAVFDGHAGARISEQCSSNLLDAICGTEEFKKIDPDIFPSLSEIKNGIREGFLSLDEKLRIDPQVTSGEDKSGTTAVCVIVSPKHIFVANCGDSRAVIMTEGKVDFGTTDHKPVNTEERERIQNAGGNVMIQRVNGTLAVSRSLGDYDYKKVEGKGPTEQLVSPEPEITIIDRRLENDELIVLACDGIWDVMSNEELNLFVQDRIKVESRLNYICNEIVDMCLYKGSRDNMSIILLAFDNAYKLDKELAERNVEVENKLKEEVKNLLKAEEKTNSAIEVKYLLNYFSTQNDLPPLPSGGILTKCYLFDQILDEWRSSGYPDITPYDDSASENEEVNEKGNE